MPYAGLDPKDGLFARETAIPVALDAMDMSALGVTIPRV